MDDKSSILNEDGASALEVACPPPGIGAKKFQEISETKFRTTHLVSAIALERAGVDLDICTIISINGSALEVACPPPGIGAKSQGRCSKQHGDWHSIHLQNQHCHFVAQHHAAPETNQHQQP
jgi:hypothetical protein